MNHIEDQFCFGSPEVDTRLITFKTDICRIISKTMVRVVKLNSMYITIHRMT